MSFDNISRIYKLMGGGQIIISPDGIEFIEMPPTQNEYNAKIFDVVPDHFKGDTITMDPPKNDDQVAIVVEMLKALSDVERVEIFRNFCKSCGSIDPSCMCWNDE